MARASTLPWSKEKSEIVSLLNLIILLEFCARLKNKD